ncbi:T9SS type A sorting domain-containing protein [Olleya namhaensis]|uniref:T9SS type A sorting domain-containing protein n=1 Tax=Olleya namhaensis TaxID=1144750 RepID=UPI002492AC76|nr:T9SS type A sorting domain-containing protein [Olleya namhaensis]
MKTKLLFISILIFQFSYSQNGSLDTSFGTNGIVINDISDNLLSDKSLSIIVKDNGAFVVSGYTTNSNGNKDIALAQYNSDGSLDTLFGTNGIVTLDINGLDEDAISSTFQSDGKIITVGETDNKVVVARFNSNGTIDTSFATNGIFVYNISSEDVAIAVAISTNHEIYIGCRFFFDYGVIKLTELGTFDSTFGTNGIVTTDLGSVDYLTDIKLLSDNKLIVTGTSGNNHSGINGDSFDKAIIKYNSDGSLDTTFNSNGIIFTTYEDGGDDSGNALIIQPDNKIVVCGSSYIGTEDDNFALARYNIDGSVDTSFGINGVSIIDHGLDFEICTSALLQGDGKILVGGYVINGTTFDFNFGLARYNSDGSIDSSFGNNGIILTDLNNNSSDYAYSMAFQNNKILLTGSTRVSGNSDDFAIVRYLADDTLGINELTENTNTYSIYPNPTSRVFYITNKSKKNTISNIVIYSINGTKIKSFSDFDLSQKIILDNLSNGVYFVEVSDKLVTETFKLVIK